MSSISIGISNDRSSYNLGPTPNIHQFVEAGNYESAKFLIESDISVIDTVDDIYGRTPLIICSFKKSDSHFKIAEFLIECGCDINIQANFKWNNWNALMTACYYNNLRMVDTLIKANVNLEIRDITNSTARELAQENGNTECVKLITEEMEYHRIEERLELIKELEDAVFRNDFALTQECLHKLKNENIKKILNSTSTGSQTLLHRACRNGNPKIVNLLLEHGAIARPHFYTKYSPLYIACHMGNIEIVKMILEKFPHLIQSCTIEKFLPYHAACSQGHLEILKLLAVSYDSPNRLIHTQLEQIFDDSNNNKYLNSFDFNSLDMNDQSGLHLAVLGNHLHICEYLLSLKVKKLDDYDLIQFSQQKLNLTEENKQIKQRTLSQLSSNSKTNDDYHDQESTSSYKSSFFDHIKNVFLDIKSYDPYVINYTSNTEEQINTDQQQVETKSLNSIESSNETSNQQLTNIIQFNPIQINIYSKFGTTCLHEAIRNKNFQIVKLLLDNGADVNLPIYENNANHQDAFKSSIQSNCLCEALIQKDEQIFSYLLENYTFNDFNLNLTFKQCQSLSSQDENFYSKQMLAHLLKLKILNDPDNKVSIKNKQSLKHLHNSASTMNISDLTTTNSLFNVENGLILNWNNLDLDVVYESMLLNSSRFFLVNNKMLRNSSSVNYLNSFNSTNTSMPSNFMFNEDVYIKSIGETAIAKMNLNLKRLHLNVITRLDLSNNNLENIPFSVFQIENLKYLKLSSNKLKKLPTNRLQESRLDDVNNELVKFEKLHSQHQVVSTWNCNYLEEIELDKNQLIELPIQLFQIKSLKHLNAANNNLETIPVEMWTAPALIEFNLSFNKLTHLPLVSKHVNETIRKNQINEEASSNNIVQPSARHFRRNDVSTNQKSVIPVNDHPLKKSITQNDVKRQVVISYEEKQIDKANFWQNHSIDSFANDNQDLLTNTVQSDEKNIKKQKQDKSNLTTTSSNTYKESKLIELNLSNNMFKRMPECLSCLAPKLAKLNLGFNLLENMGAICDLPSSLKFLDLSNNHLKRPIRLLNDNLLKFVIFYYVKYAALNNSETSDDSKHLLENNISNLLLDNEFCYLNLFKKYFYLNNSNSNQIKSFNERSRGPRTEMLIPTMSSINLIKQNELTQVSRREVSRFNSSSASNSTRRARSQSRNHRSSIANVQNQNTNSLAKRILPFDLFLINLKYNRSMRNESSIENEFLNAAVDLLLNSNNSLDFNELEKKEKLLLDNQNILLLLEQMCPHKRHIKLENLKSLNLSNNKLKHFHLMVNFQQNSQAVASPTSDLNFIPSFYSKIKDNSSKSKDNSAVLLNLKDTASNELLSDSDFTLTESDLSSVEDYDVIRNNLIESGDGERIKLKDKFQVTSVKKSMIEKKNKNLYSFTRNEERIKMISKMLYPNLTHLDFSSNKIRFVPRNLIFLENLSYLNVSSNRYLIRVSPSVGLLKKLWNFDLKNCDCLRDPANLNNLIKQKMKTADVLGFLRSILEDSRPYTRIKLMFVGVQGIGKTSVLNRLREESGTLYTSSNKQSWSERQSASYHNSTNNQNISTVGIDINEWTYEEKSSKKNPSTTSLPGHTHQKQSVYIYQMENYNKYFGPITFRTWDFAGQRDYYATHQYFISKRALYLVCWKLSEEEKGINEIHNWLSNIQTRAPGSPVIIVGTHQDQLAKLKNYKDISNYLQRLIFERFVRPTGENETSSPYPPIIASIEISSKTGYNIRQLAKLIYDSATQMKAPGIKDQLLLEQKIPVTYLALEECINYILKKLKVKSRNPVLHTNNYIKEIRQAIEELYPDPSSKNGSKNDNKNLLIRFRDDAEILQATQFLHENGIVIHYNDVALRDLYFLDPQWLCDILSTVITIREINPFAAKGIMRIKDLFVLFKGKKFSESEEIVTFIVDLLSKFELALTWDNEHLLIPSLLPSETILKYTNQDIRIGILSKKKIYNNNTIDKNPDILLQRRQSRTQLQSFTFNNLNNPDHQDTQISSLYSNVKLSNSYTQVNLANKLNLEFLYECKPMTNSITDDSDQNYVRRIYTLSYLPTGFFSRLITRILCDNILKECLLELIDIEYCFLNRETTQDFSNEANSLDALVDFVCQDAEWRCWQTGIELKYLDFTLLKVKEIINDPLVDLNNKTTDELFLNYPVLYRDCEDELKLKSPSKQCAFIECYTSFKDYKIVKNSAKSKLVNTQESELDTLVKIYCKRQVSIKIFALIIEIIDTLLEDWYPDLGTRFMQDSKGDYLVTRLAPCYKCIDLIQNKNKKSESDNASKRSSISETNQETNEFLEEDTLIFNSDMISSNEKLKLRTNIKTDWVYCFMLDDVCHAVLRNAKLNCPKHGEQISNLIAPDLAFDDIEEKYLIKTSNLKFDNIIGRGSFGSVYIGELTINQNISSIISKHVQTEDKKLKVAIKVLETFNTSNDLDKQNEIDLAQLNDDVKSKRTILNYRKSIRLAAKAYSVARQEVAIVSSLKHENIVSMIGLTLKPLAIILELATGNLKDILTEFKTNMSKLSSVVIQQVCMQTSSALVYLHSNRIIYRDLKSENVLVFNFPRSNQMNFILNSATRTNIQETNKVIIKLADYSISRSALPTGTKGFAGTEGFMAPEIVRFNGEETYSEKVDCFSFGMLMYELFSLKHPFEGQEQIKDIVLNGGRPIIKTPELFNPTLMLDLMCLCWLDNPTERPSSTELLKYTSSYEFSHLLEVVVLEDFNEMPLVVTCLNQEQDTNFDDTEIIETENDFSQDEEIEEEEEDVFDIWVVRNSFDEGASQLEILTYENQFNCTNRKMINVCCEKIESMCLYNKNQLWCIDASKCLFIFCCRTYRKINQYLLDIKSLSNIVGMYSLENEKQLLLCSSNGIIVLINVETTHELSLKNNDIKYNDIIASELDYYINDIAIKINTALLISARSDKSFDLWMGSSESEILCFSLRSMKLTGPYLHSTSYHYLTNSLLVSSVSKNVIISNENKQSEVTILRTTTTDTFFLWSYVYPGTTIFLWNHVSKKIMSAYNCRKAIDELNSAQQIVHGREIRIIEITFLNGNLYSGFNNGIVLVLKRLTLTPLFMFNAHVHQLHNLCPLTFETKLTTYYQNRSRKPTSVVKKTKNVLVSLGRALTPLHEDIYLSSSYYRDRVGALKKYANCLILNTWSCE